MKRTEKKKRSKYLSFFKLLEALKEPGCPVCTLVDRDSFRYLDALLYERVNDVRTRQELRKSLGFCNWHAWKTLEVNNCALGLAIIYGDILGILKKNLQMKLKRIRNLNPFPAELSFWSKLFPGRELKSRKINEEKIERCPACRRAQIFEKYYLEILLDYINEQEFEEKFSKSAGICFQHLQEAIENFPQHKNWPLLLKRQIEKLEGLQKELAEFVRKKDFQYAHEPRGSESDSWKRALEAVVGRKEVFSNKMR
ncbi:MAG: DUF6062 family protein [Thermodesulfobacteriota bacterium]